MPTETAMPKSSARPTDDQATATMRGRSGKDNLREIIESVAIAFVIAFLFRAFEAEAFVIPTGSMAPTLMGEHKDVFCPECDYRFQVNASGEQVASCVCPNCRYRMTFGRNGDDGPIPPTYKGDRIIVAKFTYEVSDPQRWDVGVFKYPIRPKINFIKRIVGVPNERLRIYHGDIYTAPTGSEQFAIQRKPADKIVPILQPVYDNDYQVPLMHENGWPERWQADEGSDWSHPGGEMTRFETAGKPAGAWLRYRHVVPSYDDWQALKRGPLSRRELEAIRPQFIGDFYAYDSGNMPVREGQLHWVGDLAIECELDVRGDQGQIDLELIKANRAYRCRLDVGDGSAALSAEGLPGFHPKATGVVHGAGRHRVRFVNVDQQLLVWVDGRLIEFDAPTSYDPLPRGTDPTRRFDAPGPRDLAPVGVASHGVALGVAHLRVLRDIYYIADRGRELHGDRTLGEFSDEPNSAARNQTVADDFLWVQFDLAEGQFFAMGDNSPSSSDSRLWPTQHYVPRDLLIGKATFIYWPHALNRIPYTRVWFPLFPNIERMKLID